MKNPQDIDRRAFLKQTAAAGATLAFPAAALPAQGKASERVNVAVIGCGGMGNAHIGALLNLREAGLVGIRAVCDVFTHRLDHARSRTGAEGFKDHRHVLDLKDVDAVLVATPDHWHAPITIAAAGAGKDVYCEKPMTYWKDLEDARRVVEAIARNRRVMQVGTSCLVGKTSLQTIHVFSPTRQLGWRLAAGDWRNRKKPRADRPQACARRRTPDASRRSSLGVG